MDSVKSVLVGIITGVKDSIWGIKSFYHVHKAKDKEARPSIQQITTTLSRRRQRREVNTEIKAERPKLLSTLGKCCLLNGTIICSSIVAFEYGILPSLYSLMKFVYRNSPKTVPLIWNWLYPILGLVFETLWVLPLFSASRLINSFWFQDIADTAYKSLRGRPQPVPSYSNWIADNIFSWFIQLLFLIQSFIVAHLPIIGCSYFGRCASILHICLLHSFYAFEYKWINMGWGLHKRLSFIETNWPYFIGFGLPLTIVTELLPTFVVSGSVFAVLFPLFIISANKATPRTDTCEYPLRLFRVVVYISNNIQFWFIRPNRRPRSS